MTMSMQPSEGTFEAWMDDTLRAAKRRRAEELGRLLAEGTHPSDVDVKLADPALREWVAGRPIGERIEFVDHECWRMLYVYPDEVDPAKPGKVECSGCGWIGRIEEEYTP